MSAREIDSYPEQIWQKLTKSKKKGAVMVIPRDEKLRITQRVHAKWSEIYEDRDDAEANDVYFKMYEEALAEAEEKYKDRPTNS